VRGKGLLVATLAALAVVAAPALAGVIGTAGSVTYKDTPYSLMTNESVQIQTDCSAEKNITGIGFSSDVLAIEPHELTMLSSNFAVIHVRAASNDAVTAYVMCTSAKVKYASQTKEHPAVGTGRTQVKCPGSRHVVGGGVAAESSRLIEASYPFDSKDKNKKPDDGWKATTSGLSAGDVEVTVACSKVATSYRTRSLDLSPSVSSPVVPKCKGGTHLAAVGARLSGPIQYGDLNAMRPRDGADADSVPDDEVLVNMGNSGSNPDSEKLTGYAICID
jgi:hypothetical protein